ncbi:endonuclease/exonuclease/phosphatase family protein [Flavobacterium sp. 7A]|uniref:endonuclease/exonuclease/phosphatase family protein n=1 Tax=Flavobacterium sp. 7A TaxID=2940571 RepID=UPI002225EFBE|nr:endonuclease/exonuclease/phosphatase family protein [Flavobacterium sp. 7A]MCW2118275.1 endonuclease/exonuclease/phosphatase family metal-dependent hydrolase [Flavobacterium sp. 7A]
MKSLITTLICIVSICSAQPKKYSIHTVAFYNFENLFDTINNPLTNDDEWTPKGFQHWDSKKYNQKLHNLSQVLAEIGTTENTNAPTLIGCSEIENRTVLDDLIKQPYISDKDYGIIHYDSPDKRGIDVALLYQKKHFKPTSYTNIPLIIYSKERKQDVPTKIQDNTEDEAEISLDNHRIFTRDQLLVTGYLENEEIHIIVNHWPSRSGGEKKSSPLREAAGALNRKIIDSLQRINPNAKVITMGDLNDGPFNNSLKKMLNTKSKKEEVPPLGIFNPFEAMANKGFGTIAYRDSWDIFDQVMVTQSLIQNDYKQFQFWKAGIYNKPFLIQTTGPYKGYPKRHSATEIGFSDHFPVYVYLIKEKR